MVTFINRGLFVAMPGVEIACTSDNEINSILELVINWAGGHNDLDEDGDTPESYNVAHSVQPLINQHLTCTCLRCPYFTIHKTGYILDEAIPSLYSYGTIDHPPESA
jgi:hypothetical protein